LRYQSYQCNLDVAEKFI